MEKYSFRAYGVNKARVDAGQPQLYAFARDFNGNFQKLETNLKYLTSGPSNNYTILFKSNMADNLIYQKMESRDILYFFWKYENHLRTTQQPKSSPMSEEEFITRNPQFKLTIEHIANQAPNTAIAKDSNIIPEVDKEFEGEYLHCLGNLTMDPQSSNSSKSNKDFEDKKESFSRASFKAQTEIVHHFAINDKWSKESIDKRKQHLIDFAVRNWLIDEN